MQSTVKSLITLLSKVLKEKNNKRSFKRSFKQRKPKQSFKRRKPKRSFKQSKLNNDSNVKGVSGVNPLTNVPIMKSYINDDRAYRDRDAENQLLKRTIQEVTRNQQALLENKNENINSLIKNLNSAQSEISKRLQGIDLNIQSTQKYLGLYNQLGLSDFSNRLKYNITDNRDDNLLSDIDKVNIVSSVIENVVQDELDGPDDGNVFVNEFEESFGVQVPTSTTEMSPTMGSSEAPTMQVPPPDLLSDTDEDGNKEEDAVSWDTVKVYPYKLKSYTYDTLKSIALNIFGDEALSKILDEYPNKKALVQYITKGLSDQGRVLPGKNPRGMKTQLDILLGV